MTSIRTNTECPTDMNKKNDAGIITYTGQNRPRLHHVPHGGYANTHSSSGIAHIVAPNSICVTIPQTTITPEHTNMAEFVVLQNCDDFTNNCDDFLS